MPQHIFMISLSIVFILGTRREGTFHPGLQGDSKAN